MHLTLKLNRTLCRKCLVIPALFSLILFIAACGGSGGGGGGGTTPNTPGGGGSSQNPAADISGTWDVLGYDSEGSDTLITFLQMSSDGTVSGSVEMAPITGTLSGSNLSLTTTVNSVAYTVTATLSADGNTVTGSLSPGDGDAFIAKRRTGTPAGLYSPNFIARHVAVAGAYAYVADGIGLRILDVSDTANPISVGRVETMGISTKVRVSGDFAYLMEPDTGMKIIDVSDKAAPRVVGCAPITRYASDLWVEGGYAYLLDDWTGLMVIDIGDPSAPRQVGSVGTDNWSRGLFISGTTAYVTNSNDTIQLIDISDPANPSIAGSFDHEADAIAVHGQYAYIAAYGDIEVIDISEPQNTAWVTRIDGVSAAELMRSGDTLFAADGEGGLTVIDITHPAAPVNRGTIATTAAPLGVWSDGSFAYLACGDAGLEILNIPDLTASGVVGTYQPDEELAEFNKIFVADGIAYLPDSFASQHEVQLVDVSNPAAPSLAGKLSIADNYHTPIDLFVTDGSAYLLDAAALRIWDVSNPTAPTISGSLAISSPNDIFVTDSLAYMTGTIGTDEGLHIIDVSDPAAPAPVGFYATETYGLCVVVHGDYAYIAGGDNGLRVIDVSTPATPVAAGSLDVGINDGGLHYQAGMVLLLDAYVIDKPDGSSDYATGLRIVDVTAPGTPTVRATYRWDMAGDLFVSGSTVYLSEAYSTDGAIQIQVVDIADPAAPVKVGGYAQPNLTGGGLALFAHEGRLFFPLGDTFQPQMQILDLNALGLNQRQGRFSQSTPFAPHQIQVEAGRVYAHSESNGFGILDTTNLGTITLTGSHPVGSVSDADLEGFYAKRFAVTGSHAYVAVEHALQVLDLTDPTAPSIVGRFDTTSQVEDVVLDGAVAYIVTTDKLQILDIAAPAAPTELAAITFADTAQPLFGQRLLLNENRLYVLGSSGELQIYDVSTPAAPSTLGYVNTDTSPALEIRVSAGMAYLAGGSDGLVLVDVSDPQHPAVRGSFDTGTALSVCVANGRAYVSAGEEDGIIVLDVADPDQPVPVDLIVTPGRASQVRLADDHLYVADGLAGLRILTP